MHLKSHPDGSLVDQASPRPVLQVKEPEVQTELYVCSAISCNAILVPPSVQTTLNVHRVSIELLVLQPGRCRIVYTETLVSAGLVA